jgi:hypothetical protein
MKRSKTFPGSFMVTPAQATVSVGTAAVILFFLTLTAGNAAAFELRGHIKPQWKTTNIPGDSLLQDFSDDPSHDTALDTRLNLSSSSGDWSWRSDYQLQARQGDLLELQQRYPQFGFNTTALTDDDRRILDLSHNISERNDRVIAHRLDRLYLSHTSEKTVLKIGRQAVSWGNGIIYNPVDFFNPFDPAAVDTEYKTGDDMLYAQYLQDSGNDFQTVWVGRRDEDDDVTQDVSSLALKYHFFLDASEFDVLVAEHYDAQIVAFGAVVDAGGAIWRGDIMLTDTDGEQFSSAVLNWSYAWIAGGKNMTVALEYFYNGFGIDDGDYDPQSLERNPELVDRVERGELFTLAKNYAATAATIELTPLWLLNGSLFRNLDDNSMLVQIFSEYDLQQDLQLLAGINLPGGSDGSEFGGIDSAVADETLAIGTSVFAQLAWYF